MGRKRGDTEGGGMPNPAGYTQSGICGARQGDPGEKGGIFSDIAGEEHVTEGIFNLETKLKRGRKQHMCTFFPFPPCVN